MGKYDPLKTFLEQQNGETVPMTFSEIEAVIGAPLPSSRRYPAWWSNNPWNNTMTQVWLEAGFTTEQVDIEGEKLVFRRVQAVAVTPVGVEEAGTAFTADGGLLARLRAALGGTVTFAPGFDPTEPTGETWDAER
jgi:hypothetical protein